MVGDLDVAIGGDDVDDAGLEWLIAADRAYRQARCGWQGSRRGGFGGEDRDVGRRRSGPESRVGSVATKVSSASTPPADEPTTTRRANGSRSAPGSCLWSTVSGASGIRLSHPRPGKNRAIIAVQRTAAIGRFEEFIRRQGLIGRQLSRMIRRKPHGALAARRGAGGRTGVATQIRVLPKRSWLTSSARGLRPAVAGFGRWSLVVVG